MKILVTNAGSSSLKITCFAAEGLQEVAKGMVERIGQASPALRFSQNGGQVASRPVEAADAGQALRALVACLGEAGLNGADQEEGIVAVGHRVVHGGEEMTRPVLVTPEIKELIARYAALAPLHNPPSLAGIEAAQELFPDAAQVAAFDTAFHASMPERAFIYALPWELYEQDKIRRYGFHGISHGFVFHEAARHLGAEPSGLKAVTCHLGNGCSMAAVNGGAARDTSMGFTPLEGLIMGTRCGDLDPAAVLYLQEQKGLGPAEALELMNHRSGLLALAGIGSGDLRDIEQAAGEGAPRAQLALDAFAYRIKKYIGAYAAALGGLDAVVFTAGIGENSPTVRRLACAGLEFLGLEIDEKLNQEGGEGVREISAPSSRVRLLVIPTNEELAIARQVLRVVRRED
ncbi:MAG: acetate kinase [Desulfarculaceae bacterium]|nr:acetate kinase [Desulfarculaceae bacterium]MCF8071960.1 acetate kinase [Desulfarculaceae bacterium]MCF8101477.1 acetate kinase [Desulfarculaceae bacterium]MCF8115027.1 acetate kinase [Desulfarculaceae bacterium]